MSATAQGFAAPIWMTFRQAIELNAHAHEGETGSLVVYANALTRTECDEKTGEDVEREIPYLKLYIGYIQGPCSLTRLNPKAPRTRPLTAKSIHSPAICSR